MQVLPNIAPFALFMKRVSGKFLILPNFRPNMGVLNLKVVFAGGTETLFDMQKEFNVAVPASEPVSISALLRYISSNLMPDKSRSHLLLNKTGESVRAGILVLVNDVDWDLLNGPKTVLEEGDVVSFISTIHGG